MVIYIKRAENVENQEQAAIRETAKNVYYLINLIFGVKKQRTKIWKRLNFHEGTAALLDQEEK